MLDDGLLAPDGKLWHVPIPIDRDRAVFYQPYGTTWHLYRFARDDKDAMQVLAYITLEYGQVKTAVVLTSLTENR
jgi:hypothetical protein